MKLHLRSHTIELLHSPCIMGIVNVTPDSFSDGGKLVDQEDIVRHVSSMIDAGASIIDIGGESTRPFADPVAEEDELTRVIPAIKSIRRQHKSIPISIDTTKSNVAQKALEAGADIINDISAFRFDPQMIDVAREYKSPIIIMHMQGTPSNMQVNPTYNDIISETIHFFQERINWLENNGILHSKIIIDPGIGFGKSLEHNLLILNNIEQYQCLECPVLIGHSRKSFISKVIDLRVDQRDQATAVISGILATKGVDILRVHDVETNSNAVKLALAIKGIAH